MDSRSVTTARMERLPPQRGQCRRSTSNVRRKSVAQCASSEGWRVQRESVPPGQKPGAP
jgi:hypothetical protein